jgi:hypothetical protein
MKTGGDVLGSASASVGASRTDLSQDIHQFKVGMNYRFGAAQQADNGIHYGIIDVGYALWRGAKYSIAPFAG